MIGCFDVMRFLTSISLHSMSWHVNDNAVKTKNVKFGVPPILRCVCIYLWFYVSQRFPLWACLLLVVKHPSHPQKDRKTTIFSGASPHISLNCLNSCHAFSCPPPLVLPVNSKRIVYSVGGVITSATAAIVKKPTVLRHTGCNFVPYLIQVQCVWYGGDGVRQQVGWKIHHHAIYSLTWIHLTHCTLQLHVSTTW